MDLHRARENRALDRRHARGKTAPSRNTGGVGGLQDLSRGHDSAARRASPSPMDPSPRVGAPCK
eukprot:2263480-Pyramimonas_sp.AAC.1